MSDKKYIGVDLGAWSGTKTRIAILEYNEENLKLMTLEKEPTFSTEKPEIRNKKLKDCILRASSVADTVIAIDAPFAVPSLLGCFKGIEECYPYENPKDKETIVLNKKNKDKKLSIQNQYLYDNSARFVYERTCQRVLAPTATLVGALTSRMVHIVDNYSDKLGICKTPYLEPVQSEKNKISTIEVFPTATLYQIIRTLSEVDQKKYLQPYTEEEGTSKDVSKFTKIISYKGDHWNGNRERMLALIEPFIEISNERKEEIKTDDDYDAIICALTAYWADQKDGYEMPENNLDKFTNSFIYIPKIK